MLIFYPTTSDSKVIEPVVIIDALCSDDRFSVREINESVKAYAPAGSDLKKEKIFSCEYDGKYEHNAVPLGAGIKSSFSGSIKSPPAELISAFSPRFFTSAKNFDDMGNVVEALANPQTSITNTAFCLRDINKRILAKKFIITSAPVFPDPYATTTTMLLNGGSIEDTLIKSEIAYQFNKTDSLKTQVEKLLSPLGFTTLFVAKNANTKPVSDKLYPPTTLNKLLDDLCLQNKLVYAIKEKTITFYSQGPDGNPKLPSAYEFSFLGTRGTLAYNLSVENFANLKFKSSIFDAQVFQTVKVFNDVKSAFFAGLVKVSEGNGSPTSTSALASVVNQARKVTDNDAYECYIIRYSLMWSRRESCAEVTAANNWLLAQFRINSLLDAGVFKAALK